MEAIHLSMMRHTYKMIKIHPYVMKRFESLTDDFSHVIDLIEKANKSSKLFEGDRILIIHHFKRVIERIDYIREAKLAFERELTYQPPLKERIIDELKYLNTYLNPKILLMFAEFLMVMVLGSRIFGFNFIFGMTPYLLAFCIMFFMLKVVDLIASR